MINIYDKTETVFNHSGLATLEPIECVFAPMINDVWKLEMTVPYDPDGKYKLVENDKLIRVTDLEAVSEQAGSQIFRIYDFKKQNDSVYILAYPVGLDARFETLTDYLDLRDKTASQAISLINNMAAKYTVTTDLTSVNSAEYENKNMIEILNGEDGFVHKWGGEICYDNYNIKVNRKLGNQNRSIDVRYGKNIQSMTYELDASNVVTRLYPKSQNGDILNGIPAYAYGQTRYIDSPKINDYPIIHNYYVKAPYVLLNMTDDGSLTYLDTIMIYNQIKTAVYNLVEARTNAIMTSNSNIDLGWLKWFYGLTMDSDGLYGFAERVASIAGAGCVSEEYKELVKKAVAEGFKGYFDIVDEEYEWLETEQGFIYYPNGNEDWRWKETWAKDGNTWKYINVHGYHDSISPESSKTWSWFKKKRDNFKSYGIKENATYKRLFHEQYKINDVWYYFDTTGMPYKGSQLFDMLHMDALYDEIATSAYSGTTLQTICYNGEHHMYNLLYMQMTDYCSGMFSSQGIDKPTVSMEIDVVDLSKTTEYKDYENLLKIHLGDKVKCINTKLDLASEERVIGLEYDVVRGFNRKVYIGLTENSVINMLNVSTNNEVKLIAGEGINIQNNVISVVPTPINAVKDVRIDGKSVVTANVADIDSSQFGLQYFIETENALYGTYDAIEFIKDSRYTFSKSDIKSETMTYEINNSYHYEKVTITVTPIFDDEAEIANDDVFLMAFTPYSNSYPFFINSLQLDKNCHGGILLLTSNIDAFDGFTIAGTYYDYNYNTGQTATNSGAGTVSKPTANNRIYEATLIDTQGRTMFYGNPPLYSRATVQIDGKTWYGIWFFKKNFDAQQCTAPSIQEYLPASDLPHNSGNIIPYDNLGQVVTQAVPLWKTGDGSCSGIARSNNLAFFAGGNDELGNGAPIKIFNDGTYIGLDKVEDVTVNGQSVVNANKVAEIEIPALNAVVDVKVDNQSVVDNNHVANIDLSGKQDVLTPGANIQIQNGTISATDTTYSDFDGSTHGLVPPALSGDSGKFLKSDGTWAEAGGGGGGTSDLDAVELTKAQYDALTPEQKADEDKIYFVKDYIPPQSGGGSTVSITPSLSSGTKVADYEIDGVAGELYAPTPSAGSVVEIHPLLASGREIASFTINGVTNYLYGFDWWYTNAIACTMSSEVTINAGGIALCTFYAPVNNVENAYIFQGINLRGRKTDEQYSASMVLMATVSEVYLAYDNDRIRLRIYVYNHHNYDVIISGAYAQFVEII